MSLTVHDIVLDADLFRAAYPEWPSAPAARQMPEVLATLRASLVADGCTAVPAARLDPEARRMALEDRWNER